MPKIIKKVSKSIKGLLHPKMKIVSLITYPLSLPINHLLTTYVTPNP